MAFCFKRKESIGKAISRLACERIDRAIECLKDSARAEAIHSARKEIKKTNAVLRLARAGVSKKEFRGICKRLKKAAGCLSSARDAAVIAKTLRDLARRSKGLLASTVIRDMRLELQRASRKAAKRLVKKGMAVRSEKILAKARKDFCELKIEGKDWDVIGRGVIKAYEGGQRAYHIASNHRSAEQFHEWRKSAKDLWYQVTMLHPMWPEQMDAMARELEALGECLGDDHDLFVLQCWVEEQDEVFLPDSQLELLRHLIEDRQRDLRTQALDIAKRFYAETGFSFCERLESYWRSWRNKKVGVGSARRS